MIKIMIENVSEANIFLMKRGAESQFLRLPGYRVTRKIWIEKQEDLPRNSRAFVAFCEKFTKSRLFVEFCLKDGDPNNKIIWKIKR